MADSLREQLIAAGLATAAPEPARKSRKPAKGKRKRPTSPAGRKPDTKPAAKPSRAKAKTTDAASAASAEKKKLKLEIKALIDAHRVEPDKWKGDVPYRYQIEKKLREVYVTEDIQKQLAARELAITRLNGSTHLVPGPIALQIRAINPLWTVFNLDGNSGDETPAAQDDEYGAFTVPDDLNW